MKNFYQYIKQFPGTSSFIVLLIIALSTSNTYCQTISVFPNNATCGNSDGYVDVSISVVPPCTATTCDLMSLDRITPVNTNIITGPSTQYLSFNIPSLSIGYYEISVEICGTTLTSTFFIGDNSIWPVVPNTTNSSTRVFNKDLGTDSYKNVYAGGWYDGSFDFYPLNPITSGGSFSSYLAKFDECGNGLWLNNIWSNDPVSCKINAISVTSIGDVVVCGDYNSSGPLTYYTINFSNSINHTFSNNNGGFIAKYNSNGTCLWAALIRDGISAVNLRDVSIDGLGNIFVLGDFDSDVIHIELYPISNSTFIDLLNSTNPSLSDVFLVVYDGSGNYITSNSSMQSSPFDDFAGGLAVVRSVYPTNVAGIVGGNVTEIILTGQGGILQCQGCFMGQRWILDNTAPTQTLAWINDFILNTPQQTNPPNNEFRYGMSVDYFPYGSEYMFVISGISENQGDPYIGRPFIASFKEPMVWTTTPGSFVQTSDYYDFVNNNQNIIDAYNIASNVSIDKSNGNIKIGGLQREPYVQRHPFSSPNISVGNSSTSIEQEIVFYDNFRTNFASLDIGNITESLFSKININDGNIIADYEARTFDLGYVGVCTDDFSRSYASVNFSGIMGFDPSPAWGTVTSGNIASSCMISRIIDGINGEVEFKRDLTEESSGSIAAFSFNLTPNPCKETVHIQCQGRSQAGIDNISILNSLGICVWEEHNFDLIATNKIDIRNFIPGLYFVTIKSGNNIKTQKLIVQ